MILLDTHVLLWLVLGDSRLKPAVRRRITAARDIGVSSISFWEVAMLVRLGRIRSVEPVAGWRAAVLSLGILDVPIEGEIAWQAGAMDHATHLHQLHPTLDEGNLVQSPYRSVT